jgi:hypothetical protein
MIRHDLARSLGGACLLLTTLILVSLALVHRWITDTSEQRRALAEKESQADAERSRYFALEAALEGEHARLSRDLAGERAALAAQLDAERRALEAVFEERCAALICETTEAVVQMIHDGKLAPTTPAHHKVIQLRDHQQRRPERERTREHGVVGP